MKERSERVRRKEMADKGMSREETDEEVGGLKILLQKFRVLEF
ncbi:hypothetical protein CAEBREN_29317 [Caenorhabditis brenneri]|uniref:Uncharacterized protein n=1 Tax=Caenorhabditis brenneri TaxID=135651 RepID=G0NR60_CAEBE|nr:hypothetical protein CAEBREN_29317 [Caenorhabditis brenneri]